MEGKPTTDEYGTASTTNFANGTNGGGKRGGAPMDTDGRLVVARRVEPGAVRRFEPPGSPRRATAGKRPKNAKNGPIFRKIPVFRPKIADFHRKMAQNGPETAFSGNFSPAMSVAARFR